MSTTPRTARVVVSSTRAANGTYEDRSGPLLVDWLRRRGFACEDALVVPDAGIRETVDGILGDRERLPEVVLTSGGTGIGPEDRTVEAVAPHLELELPGIMHAFWARGRESVPTSVLSRGVAGTLGRTFVMTLPGSTGGVRDGIAVLDPVLDHLLAQLEGRRDH